MNFHTVLVIRSNSVSDLRMEIAARALKAAGYQVKILSEVPYYELAQEDLIICQRPGDSMCGLLREGVKAGLPVVVDMDDDFSQIPADNPSYKVIGPANFAYHQILKYTIEEATILTTPTPVLAERYKRGTWTIPNAWDDQNGNWKLPKVKHAGTRFGWIGTTTHRDDFELCRESLLLFLAGRPDCSIVIGADEKLYKHFYHIPESQKLFIPGLSAEEYPCFYSYIDVLLIPLKDTRFNQAKSDIKCVEAGAGRAAWIASPMPMYKAWGGGGMYASEPEAWTVALQEMAKPCTRQLLADQGYDVAQERSSTVVGAEWVKIADELLGVKR